MDSCASADGPQQIEGALRGRSASFSPRYHGSLKAVVLVEGPEVLHGPKRKGFLSPRMISTLPLLNAQPTGSRDQC